MSFKRKRTLNHSLLVTRLKPLWKNEQRKKTKLHPGRLALLTTTRNIQQSATVSKTQLTTVTERNAKRVTMCSRLWCI